MNNVKFYKVGGCVRDKLLNLPFNDIDYAVESPTYGAMLEAIKLRGGEIFLEKPEFFSVRAKVPDLGAADFTLCRKDGYYSDHRHPDSVEVGSLEDDLSRRDFTINAIAEDEDGNIIDPFHGAADLEKKIIQTVGSATERMTEDPLRMLRAVRFSITKGFILCDDLHYILQDDQFISLVGTVKKERVYEELRKCFLFDTMKSIHFFNTYWRLRNYIFTNFPIRLEPKIFPVDE